MKERNKVRLVFEANTFTYPKYLVTKEMNEKIKGCGLMKVLNYIVRNTVGYVENGDSVEVSNGELAKFCGLKLRQTIMILKQMKYELNIIDYEECKGGRSLKNIRLLLPEVFYSRQLMTEMQLKRQMESLGYTVIKNNSTAEDKSKQVKIKPVETELKNNINSSTGLIIKYRFERTLDKKYYDAFFEPCKFYLDGVFLFVICPSTVIKNHIIKKYSSELQAVAEEITKQKIVLKIQLKEGDKQNG